MADDYLQLLPVHEREFATRTGHWLARVTRSPRQGASDRVQFRIYFEPAGLMGEWHGPSVRNLNLWVSDSKLHHGGDRYRAAVYGFIENWLDTDAVDEEREYLGE